MYYDSKTSFYLKQYFLPIMTLIVSIILVIIGIYVYWASNSDNAQNQTLVSTNTNNSEDQNNDSNNNQTSNETSLFGEYVKTLQPMEKSIYLNIKSISDDGKVIIDYNGEEVSLNLVGVDKDNLVSNYVEILNRELNSKSVKIAFDVEKTKDNEYYTYIYTDDTTLFNEYILENGLSKYKSVTNDKNCQKVLIQAQTYAKQLKRGVWAK